MRILVADLDGTLLRSDMLYETFWASAASDWRTPWRAAAALRGGRAGLKRSLTGAPVRVDLLPYNTAVIHRLKDWRAAGGRTALVTASDQIMAEAVAAHLGLFDHVHGSDGAQNLKGPAKAAFLVETFGEGGFDYMGDSPADLPVWERAHTTITVDAGAGLRARAEALKPGADRTRHLGEAGLGRAAYFKAMRPHQWLKNLLVFLPMIAAHQFTMTTITASVLAFVAFSLVASSVYVLNDLLDLAADRTHPRKRARVLAAGGLPLSHGTMMAPALALAGAAVGLGLGLKFLAVLAGYYAITFAYSLVLKRKPVVDICTLAGLYTLRIVAGAAATGIPLSVWLLAFSIFLFFSLAAVKRQAELVDNAARGTDQAAGRGYLVTDLPLVASMATASGYVSVLVMALYLDSPGIGTLYTSPALLWGICLVLLFWISRMVMTTHRGLMNDDPVVYAIKDPVSRVCGVLIAAFAIAGTLL